jgi:hypothetical protein
VFAPAPPRTPSARARELVFAYQGGQRMRLIVGVILLVIGLVQAVGFGRGAIVDLALDVAGEPCRAEVLGVEVLEHVRMSREHPTEIRFTCTQGGVAFESRSATRSQEILARVEPGAVLEAEVLPSLSVGRIAGTTHATLGRFELLFHVSPIVGLVLVLGAWRSNRREIRAFVHGTAVRGRVVSRDRRGMRVNRRRPWVVRWELEVEGRRYEGSISHMDEATLQAAIPTDDVVVLYDPRRPAVNTVYIA